MAPERRRDVVIMHHNEPRQSFAIVASHRARTQTNDDAKQRRHASERHAALRCRAALGFVSSAPSPSVCNGADTPGPFLSLAVPRSAIPGAPVGFCTARRGGTERAPDKSDGSRVAAKRHPKPRGRGIVCSAIVVARAARDDASVGREWGRRDEAVVWAERGELLFLVEAIREAMLQKARH